jgi:hypothetical protein
MSHFLKHYGTTEGPLGLPMQDRQAFLLESILKALPPEDRALKHAVVAKAPTELLDGERADVSWISTEEIDRDREIVVSRGMNDAHFKLNPLVTLQHAYWRPPVGRSLWRKRVKDGPLVGIKAKTHFPPRPADWVEECWDPDTAFSLIKAGLLQGKSIGFIVLKSHAPSSHEIAARPELADVCRIIDEWLLLEYACVFLPSNQSALVEAVSKGAVTVPEPVLRALGFEQPLSPAPPPPPVLLPFTPVEEIGKELRRHLERLNVTALIEGRIQEVYDAARGRV